VPAVLTAPDIRQVLLNAQIFKLNAPNRTALMNLESVPEAVEKLFALLTDRKVPFVLVGGLALLQHVPGRNTEDIDLILATSVLPQVSEIEVKSGEGFFRLASYAGLRVELLLSENPLFDLICRQHAEIRQILGHNIACATPAGLVLMKLYALPSLYRQGDFTRVSLYEGDIANLLFQHRVETGPLLQELTKHLLPSDQAEVTKITKEIEERIARFRSR